MNNNNKNANKRSVIHKSTTTTTTTTTRKMLTKYWVIQLSVQTERKHVDYIADEAKNKGTNNERKSRKLANYLQQKCSSWISFVLLRKAKILRTLFSYEMCHRGAWQIRTSVHLWNRLVTEDTETRFSDSMLSVFQIPWLRTSEESLLIFTNVRTTNST
jgi:hypothetical protein